MKRLYGFYRAQVTEVNIDDNDYGAIRIFIPSIMIPEKDSTIIEDESGLIALPANNAIGGRNDKQSGSYGYGQVLVPRKGDWVWIFFEGGMKNKPFYFNSVNILNTKLPPENRNVEDPSTVYTIIRSQNGRIFVVADSPDVQRIEITGKKRINTIPSSPDGSDQEPYNIDGNQTTILLDERDGKEKLLIRTHKGDYLHIDIDEQELQCYFKNDITIQTDGNYNLKVGKQIKIECVDDYNCTSKSSMYNKCNMEMGIESNGRTDIKSNQTLQLGSSLGLSITSGMNISLDGLATMIQSGSAIPPNSTNPSTPKEPIGDRDS